MLFQGIATVADGDYVAVSDTPVFPIGSTDGAMQCATITIVDDEVFEIDETFTATLTPSTADVALGNAVVIITITDDG